MQSPNTLQLLMRGPEGRPLTNTDGVWMHRLSRPCPVHR